MSIKNTLFKFLIAAYTLVRRKKTMPSLPERVLVISTTGLGDTLWGTPALRSLKASYPKSFVAVLTSPIGKEILECNPYCDACIVVKTCSFFELLRLWIKLRRGNFDTALVFHTSQRPILPLCTLAGISRMVGTKGINKGLDSLLTDPIEPQHEHEIQRRLRIVDWIGASKTHPLLELYLSDRDEELAKTFLEQHNIPLYIPIVGLHPGAKDKFKRWPPEHFARLGNLLKDHLGCQIIVTGNAAENKLVDAVSMQIKGSIAVKGELTLRPFAALMRRMALVIANDTGPMHIAFAMQTPTVALFAPTDPQLCGPYMASKVKVVQKLRTCSPCLRKKCLEPLCMMQIGIQEAYEKALELFYQQKTRL